jgi:dipeptidase D
MENRKAIVLQGHLDMVHKKFGYRFDFDTQGIDMYVDEIGFVLMEPLGADNGLELLLSWQF